jgi:hypothetical protein
MLFHIVKAYPFAVTNWFDIADTAIKIGLGTLVGGIFSVALIFAAFVKDKWSDKRTRRLKHIEEAVMGAERYLNYLIKHASNAAWHHASDLNASDKRFAAKDYERSYARWDEALDDLNTATSRLALFGYEPISDKLREASMFADNLLREIESGGPSEEQATKFEVFRLELGRKRREVIGMLRGAYNQ